MPRRVDADVLLVGSLPTSSTESALRDGAALFAGRVFALPDGESGPRSPWVSYDRTHLICPHPAVETVTPTASPTGVPRHANEVTVVRLRPGVDTVRFDSWPRIDEAIASYETFTALRDEGVIDPGVRFQVGLPFPTSVLSGFRIDFAADYPVVGAGYEELVGREIERMLDVVPAEDLAIQWDIMYEVLDNEGILPWTAPGAWERFCAAIERLAPTVPDDVLMGVHLCYGTTPEWPMYETRDMDLVVRMANYAVAHAGRPVDWLHLAGPRYLRSEDDAFFAPLERLRPGDAQVFLGIVQGVDGADGLADRHRTASRHLDDFGVAMYCGFGRQQGQDPATTFREHAEVTATVTRPRDPGHARVPSSAFRMTPR